MEEVSEMNRNNFQFSILLVDQVTILAHRGYALLTSLRFPVVPCKKLQLIQQNHFRGQEKEEKKGGDHFPPAFGFASRERPFILHKVSG